MKAIVDGVRFRDLESGTEYRAGGKVVINATGPFTDSVRRMADPSADNIIAPSQGIHLVFDASFLSSDSAIMVPHTADGRVMFAIPWHGHTWWAPPIHPSASPRWNRSRWRRRSSSFCRPRRFTWTSRQLAPTF